jgi:hypothetical protein
MRSALCIALLSKGHPASGFSDLYCDETLKRHTSTVSDTLILQSQSIHPNEELDQNGSYKPTAICILLVQKPRLIIQALIDFSDFSRDRCVLVV